MRAQLSWVEKRQFCRLKISDTNHKKFWWCIIINIYKISFLIKSTKQREKTKKNPFEFILFWRQRIVLYQRLLNAEFNSKKCVNYIVRGNGNFPFRFVTNQQNVSNNFIRQRFKTA